MAGWVTWSGELALFRWYLTLSVRAFRYRRQEGQLSCVGCGEMRFAEAGEPDLIQEKAKA